MDMSLHLELNAVRDQVEDHKKRLDHFGRKLEEVDSKVDTLADGWAMTIDKLNKLLEFLPELVIIARGQRWRSDTWLWLKGISTKVAILAGIGGPLVALWKLWPLW